MIWIWVTLAVLALLALGGLFCLLPRRGERGVARLRRFRYAHRGLHNMQRGVPENSLLAFRYAVSGGFGVEMDVRLSRDRVPVVIHDGHLQRLCGVEGFVERSTVEQLQQTPLLGSRERIPTLEEALATVKGQVPVLLDTSGKALSLGLEALPTLVKPNQDELHPSKVDRALSWSALSLLVAAMVLGLWQPEILREVIDQIALL